VIRLTRTIEYEYESLEDMASDLTCWTLRTGTTRAGGRSWFDFGPKRRARSRIDSVVVTEDDPL
jgi:hypothetical protein